jgi:predicted TIM-barrel enzyme
MAIRIPDRSISRAQIIERLNATLQRGEPIIGVSAGVGIVAKCAERAGADFIVIEASSKSRNLGVPTYTYLGNPTQMMLDMYPEIDNVVNDTPVVIGWDATDGTRRRMGHIVERLTALGVNGVTNFPSSVGEGTNNWGIARMDAGMGVDREWELMTLANEGDLFSVGMAYTAMMATELAKAGADLIVARCGLTIGGMSGPKADAEGAMSKEVAAAHVQELIEAARAENPDVFVVAHGGPWARPEDTDYLYANTDVQGLLAESAVERIAVEDYVSAEIRSYKEPTLRESARHINKKEA